MPKPGERRDVGVAGAFGVTDDKHKDPVDYRKIWARPLNIAGTKFVPLYERISGDIGNLKVNDSFRYKSTNLPIDTLIVDWTCFGEEDDEVDESDFL